MDVAGPANYQRDGDAAFIEELFAAEVRPAVVAKEKDDSIINQAVVFKPFEDRADFFVEDLDAFEIVGPVAACDWVVGIIRGQLDLVFVDWIVGVFLENPVCL